MNIDFGKGSKVNLIMMERKVFPVNDMRTTEYLYEYRKIIHSRL